MLSLIIIHGQCKLPDTFGFRSGGFFMNRVVFLADGFNVLRESGYQNVAARTLSVNARKVMRFWP